MATVDQSVGLWCAVEPRGPSVSSLCMQTLAIIEDPTHWQQHAEEARKVADQLDDPIAKRTMLDVARSYEQLAALAEAKLPFQISQ